VRHRGSVLPPHPHPTRTATLLQVHRSFLDNLGEDESLEVYKFPLWDFHALADYKRWSINALVFKGAFLSIPDIAEMRILSTVAK
jgi:hypothetical protein